MCRHLGYLGPPVAVGEILTRGSHSLRMQAWAPTDMRGGGTINADGFGVAWWVPVAAVDTDTGGGERVDLRGSGIGDDQGANVGDAGRAGGGTGAGEIRVAGRIGGRAPIMLRASHYRNPAPIWTDPAVDEVLPQLRSGSVLGAVRSATVGMPVERSACAPFIDRQWAFSHNGVIPDWRTVLPKVALEFGAPDLLTAESATDSAALWVIVRAALSGGRTVIDGEDATGSVAPRARRIPGPPPADAEGTAPEPDRPSAGQDSREFPPAERGGLPADAPDRAREADASVLHPRTHVAGAGGTGPGSAAGEVADALAAVVLAVVAHAPAARLNLLLGDGESLWATTVYHSLATLITDDFAVVSSEPYDDDPRWRPVADRQVLTIRPGHLTVTPLHSHHISAGPDESERARS